MDTETKIRELIERAQRLSDDSATLTEEIKRTVELLKKSKTA